MTDLPKSVEDAIKECVPDLDVDEDHARASCERRLKFWRDKAAMVDGPKWVRRELSTLRMRLAVAEAVMEEVSE